MKVTFIPQIIKFIGHALTIHLPTFLIVTLAPLIGITADHSMEHQHTCDEGPYSIAVFVHGLRNNQGTIKAKLYGDNPDDFLVSGKKLNAKRVPAKQESLPLCLYAPTRGVYAVVVHHDENGNKKLDQNWIGMPTEGIGFSNNPKLFLVPPNHEEVTFSLLDDTTIINIKLHY